MYTRSMKSMATGCTQPLPKSAWRWMRCGSNTKPASKRACRLMPPGSMLPLAKPPRRNGKGFLMRFPILALSVWATATTMFARCRRI
ncbi:hypothetical protein [Lysobacter gummosus]|uniref:hypothetical protein n=1 Tax=Lysobacter gummosus TaxID=262324 RepID=UPI003638FA1D